jgi:polyketide synthase PksJ
MKTVRLDDGRFTMVQLHEGAPGAPTILCFAFAGGGPSAFKALSTLFPREYTVWAIDFPGHVRTKGEPLTTVTALAKECLRLMPMDLLTTSFFLGYSFGGYVAHALTVELEKMGYRVPGVILAASTPPSVRDERPSLAALDDAGQLRWLLSIGHPSNARAQRELYEVFKDAIRADIKAYDSYRPFAPIAAPALVLAGSHDPMCRAEQMNEWCELTTQPTIAVLPGGHYFIDTATQAMADRVTSFVKETLAAAQALQSASAAHSGIRLIVDLDAEDEGDTELFYRQIA